MKRIGSYLVMLGACVLAGCSKPAPDLLTSPDKQLQVKVFVTEQNTLAYSVERAAQPVILESDLGLQLTTADFTHGVVIEFQSSIAPVTDDYTMRVGKKKQDRLSR